jgi:hypothetical protein
MSGPAWLSDAFAAAMLVIAAYCAMRLAVAGWRVRETELDADGLHLVMGVAMAGMLTPRLSLAPASAWTAVFAVATAWFAWQELRVRRGLGTGPWRCPYPVPHLAESLAMVYMLAAAGSAGPRRGAVGMAGMGGAGSVARLPELAVVFALFMAGYVAWLGDRFSAVGAAVITTGEVGTAVRSTTGTARPARMGTTAQADGCWPALAPRGVCCYKIAMAIVMGYMLIIML